MTTKTALRGADKATKQGLLIRPVPGDVRDAFRAHHHHAHPLTQWQYLAALMAVHDELAATETGRKRLAKHGL